MGDTEKRRAFRRPTPQVRLITNCEKSTPKLGKQVLVLVALLPVMGGVK